MNYLFHKWLIIPHDNSLHSVILSNQTGVLCTTLIALVGEVKDELFHAKILFNYKSNLKP